MKCVSVFDCESQTEPSENWPVSSFHELLLFAQIFAHSGGSLPPGWSLQTLDRLSLDGVDETTEGVCFTYASIDKRSWETLWLKTIVITKSNAAAERDLRSIYHHHPLTTSSYAEIDQRGLTCVIFTRSRVVFPGGVSSIATAAKTHSTVETRRIVTFGDVLALLLHNSSSSSPPLTTMTTTRDQPSASIMDLNLKTPEPYQNQAGAQLANYACPPTPVFPDAPNLDYMPPSLPAAPPPPPPNGIVEVEDQLEDDVISIDESNRGLVIDESTQADDDAPHSPSVDSRRSSPGLPSPLGHAHHEDHRHEAVRHFTFGSFKRRDSILSKSQYQSDGDQRCNVIAPCGVQTFSDAAAVGKRTDDTQKSNPCTLPEQAEKVTTSLKNYNQTSYNNVCRKAPVDPKRLYCNECQKSFVWKKSFDQHMKVHTGVREFDCPQCKRAFSLKKQLVRHLKNHHKAQNQFDCHSCDKKFILEGDLRTHLESHAPKKTIKCPYGSTTGCDKTFTSKSLLVIHLRVHTGEKPFKCHVCPKAYQQNQHLKEHLYTHSGELPFLCELCSKGFKSQAQLTLHLKMHANDRRFVCHVEGCGKNYVTKALLTKHVKTVHLGERPYLCSYCEKTYPKIYDLKNHIRSHTGERPFQCEVCLKDFAHKVVWRRHMLLHESANDEKDGAGGEGDKAKGNSEDDACLDVNKNHEFDEEIAMQSVNEGLQERRETDARIDGIGNDEYSYHDHWKRQNHPNQWKRHDVFDGFRGTEELGVQRITEPVVEEASLNHSQARVLSDQFPPPELVGQQDPETANHSIPRETQSPQQHFHQHPKYRYLRKENAYSPSTLSAYSETNNDAPPIHPAISTSGPSDARYSSPPPPRLEPQGSSSSSDLLASQPPDQCPRTDAPHSDNSPAVHPEPSQIDQSSFALTKLRGVSLSHALPLPAPSHHALSLSAHPAIQAISGYAHPFNYSLCSSFFPTFPTAPEESIGSSNAANSSLNAHSYTSFVVKPNSSL